MDLRQQLIERVLEMEDEEIKMLIDHFYSDKHQESESNLLQQNQEDQE